MVLQKSELAKVARLARLAINDEEMKHFQEDLARIVTYVEQLNEVDVSGVLPMLHAGSQALTFRNDVAFETLGRECIKSSAGYEDGLIRVPKIIE